MIKNNKVHLLRINKTLNLKYVINVIQKHTNTL